MSVWANGMCQKLYQTLHTWFLSEYMQQVCEVDSTNNNFTMWIPHYDPHFIQSNQYKLEIVQAEYISNVNSLIHMPQKFRPQMKMNR